MAGADCVGMSTVPEVIVAVQEKVLCMAMSLVTNCVRSASVICILEEPEQSAKALAFHGLMSSCPPRPVVQVVLENDSDNQPNHEEVQAASKVRFRIVVLLMAGCLLQNAVALCCLRSHQPQSYPAASRRASRMCRLCSPSSARSSRPRRHPSTSSCAKRAVRNKLGARFYRHSLIYIDAKADLTSHEH